MTEYYMDLRTEFLSALYIQKFMSIFSSMCVCMESSWAADNYVPLGGMRITYYPSRKRKNLRELSEMKGSNA